MRNLMKMGLVMLALTLGACSSDKGNSSGMGGSGGGAGGSGGGTDAAAGGADGGASPTTIMECAGAGSATAVNDCIINLPTSSVGQAVTFTPSADYTACKMM